MKCSECGKECFRGEQTCTDCGTSLAVKYSFDEIDFVFEEESEEESERTNTDEILSSEQQLEQTIKSHRKRTKQIFGRMAFVIGILIVIILISRKVTQQKEYSYVPITDQSLFSLPLYVDGSRHIALFRLDGELVHTIESDQMNLSSYSLSRRVVALTAGSDQRLYVVTGKGQISLDADVDSYLVSQDGTSVAYIKGAKDNFGELYLYDVASKKSRKIDSGVSMQNCRLSPDGDSILYCKWPKVGVQQELYVSIDKTEPKKIADWELPVGISNHGKFLYVMGEEEFYVQTGKEKITLGDKSYIYEDTIMFNLDHTQVIYNEDGKTYLSIEGKVKKIADSTVNSVLLPPDAGYDGDDSGASQFINHVIQKEDGVYYLNDQYELKYICKSVDNWQVEDNMRSLLVIENQELYLYKNYENNSVIKKKIGDANNIMRFSASSDLSIIYYLNDKRELYSVKEDGEPIKISDNVGYEFTYNYNDGFCYYITVSEDNFIGDLYYSVDQQKGKKVKNLEQGAIGRMVGGVLGARILEDNKTDLYILSHGEAKLIIPSVSQY